ncbi:hypothetical protein BDN72DRAFT_781593, partial [Pluteus cervinus]
LGHWTLDNVAVNDVFVTELANLLNQRQGLNFYIPAHRRIMWDTSIVDLARGLVRYMRASGKRREDFANVVRVGNENNLFSTGGTNSQPIKLKVLEFLRDVPTRWDSFYYSVRRIRYNKQPLLLFAANPAHAEVRKWMPSESQWRELEELEAILSIPHGVQQTMSKEKTPVLAGVVPTFEVTMTALERLGQQNPQLTRYTDVAVEYFKKYYNRLDNTPAYVIAMFLNPNVRLEWIQAHWERDYINDAINHIKDAVGCSPIKSIVILYLFR